MSETLITEKCQQDLANNNHITSLEAKTLNLSLNHHENHKYQEEVFLFDPNLLLALKPAQFKFAYDKFEPKNATEIDLGDHLILRPLKRTDYDRHYMPLLAQLTQVGDVSQAQFRARFDQMLAATNTYYICVVEDVTKAKLVASLTLVFEQKFIRQAASRGRVEDMVVDAEYRGKRLSKLLLDVICALGKELGCYKISLECKDHLRKHYEQFGFTLEPEQNYLCQRFQ